MSDKPSDAEIVEILERICGGKEAVEIEGEWGYCGNVRFRSESGWRFVVFNDCDEFDYFDTIIAPDGREIYFDDMASRSMPDDGFSLGAANDVWARRIDHEFREVWGIPK